jgi:hypothetical protein
MAYTAILQRIRLLIPEELDEHYEAVRRGFEEGDLTAPTLRNRSPPERGTGIFDAETRAQCGLLPARVLIGVGS